MKNEIVIDNISNVFGDWDHGFAVDVRIHREPVDGPRGEQDGFESVRVHLDRDRLIKPDGTYNDDEVYQMVRERVGETEECED